MLGPSPLFLMRFDEGHLRTPLILHDLTNQIAPTLYFSHSTSFCNPLSKKFHMNIIREFLQPKEAEKVSNKMFPLRVVDDHQQPELSLGPSVNSPETDTSPCCKKRKHTWDESSMGNQTSIDLHINDPLPRDWEQCLDLQSGRMYYLNRKTLKKSWVRPREQSVNLELNISTLPSSGSKATTSSPTRSSNNNNNSEQYQKKYINSSGSMVAVACLNCHLLVMLSKSSPSCPNCKYVHTLLPSPPRKIEAVKSLETLSLLH